MKFIEKLMLKESLIALIPTILVALVWAGIIFIGLQWINNNFLEDQLRPLIVIVWLISMLSLSKIIPSPYSVSIQEEIKEDEK